MKTTIINKISFLNLFPYPLIIASSDWNTLPDWQKLQLEHGGVLFKQLLTKRKWKSWSFKITKSRKWKNQ
jgi:hypothetical protein